MSEHLRIIVPEGSFGVEDEGTWAGLLRRLTREIADRGGEVSAGLLGGEYGYGAYFENGVFLMHPFCWCDQDDCPWCGGCSCEVAYFHGAALVDEEEFFLKFKGFSEPGARSEITKQCDYCATGGLGAAKGGNPGTGAPNFWHKATGVKVWWYKYIGRSMEFDGFGDPVALVQDCIASLPGVVAP